MRFVNNVEEKIVGSTFYPHTLDELGLKKTSSKHKKSYVPTKSFDGQIVPEPENRYDKNAKRIELYLRDSQNQIISTIKIGYLAKDSNLYRALKVCTHKAIQCSVKVFGYSNVGLNNQYNVIVKKSA